MDLFSEVLFAEPTVSGYVGAGIVHLILWMFFGSWECGVMKYLQDFVKRRAPVLYHETVPSNYKDDPVVEMLDLQGETSVLWVSNFLTVAHHGTAGLLMLVGLVWDRPWVWRHGLLTQLWGMDIADFVRVAWCLLLPPGPYPMCITCRQPSMIGFIMFHHTTSLLAGLPGSIYLQDSIHFQWMGCFLAGAPLVFVAWDLFAKCVPSKFSRFHMASCAYMTGMFAFQRIIVYLPMAWTLSGIVIDAPMPWWAKTCLFIGGFNMTLFNFLCAGLMLHSCVEKFKANAREQGDKEVTINDDSEINENAATLLGHRIRDDKVNGLKYRAQSDKEDAKVH